MRACAYNCCSSQCQPLFVATHTYTFYHPVYQTASHFFTSRTKLPRGPTSRPRPLLRLQPRPPPRPLIPSLVSAPASPSSCPGRASGWWRAFEVMPKVSTPPWPTTPEPGTRCTSPVRVIQLPFLMLCEEELARGRELNVRLDKEVFVVCLDFLIPYEEGLYISVCTVLLLPLCVFGRME